MFQNTSSSPRVFKPLINTGSNSSGSTHPHEATHTTTSRIKVSNRSTKLARMMSGKASQGRSANIINEDHVTNDESHITETQESTSSVSGQHHFPTGDIFKSEDRILRERCHENEIRKMKDDLLYKLLFTEDIEFKRGHLGMLSNMIDDDYGVFVPELGKNWSKIGDRIRSHANVTEPDLEVWNTLIFAGLYLEPKFLGYFMPHLSRDTIASHASSVSSPGSSPGIRPTYVKLLPSMKAAVSAQQEANWNHGDVYATRSTCTGSRPGLKRKVPDSDGKPLVNEPRSDSKVPEEKFAFFINFKLGSLFEGYQNCVPTLSSMSDFVRKCTYVYCSCMK